MFWNGPIVLLFFRIFNLFWVIQEDCITQNQKIFLFFKCKNLDIGTYRYLWKTQNYFGERKLSAKKLSRPSPPPVGRFPRNPLQHFIQNLHEIWVILWLLVKQKRFFLTYYYTMFTCWMSDWSRGKRSKIVPVCHVNMSGRSS